ncbi:MAG: SGNH/GDSL hydrolase family protein, partial [Pseudomonadota bacterium]
MDAGTFAVAAKVMVIGDSITHGWLGDTDPVTQSTRDIQAGYRDDLYNGFARDGLLIDYVGTFESGPDTLLDQAHSGDPGVQLRQIATSSLEPAHLPTNVQTHQPDVTVLMAGTNDFNTDGALFFSSMFPSIMSNLTTAITDFYSLAGSADRHLIVSTIPPKLRLGTEEVSEMVNEGYSIVNGDEVAGDAGNGSYVPGIKATVAALQASHATLHLHDAPFNTADVGADDIHLTDAGYAAYAASLRSTIETTIGLAAGTIDGAAQTLPGGDNVIGGQAGDLIEGTASANQIEGGGGNDILSGNGGDDTLLGDAGRDALDGGAGADQLTGGADADVFIFDTDFAGASPDRITDFGTGADSLAFADIYLGEIIVSDDPNGSGVILDVSDGGSPVGSIIVEGSA